MINKWHTYRMFVVPRPPGIHNRTHWCSSVYVPVQVFFRISFFVPWSSSFHFEDRSAIALDWLTMTLNMAQTDKCKDSRASYGLMTAIGFKRFLHFQFSFYMNTLVSDWYIVTDAWDNHPRLKRLCVHHVHHGGITQIIIMTMTAMMTITITIIIKIYSSNLKQ